MVHVPQRGETALHMAARSGQAEVVRYLVQDGAQVEAKAKVCVMQQTLAPQGETSDFHKSSTRIHGVVQEY